MFYDNIGLNIILNEKTKLIYKYNIDKIACTNYRYHKKIPTRLLFILIEIFLSILFVLYNLILSNRIIEENNQKIKEILKLIHIKPIYNYLSYSFIYFIQLTFISLFIISKFFFIKLI